MPSADEQPGLLSTSRTRLYFAGRLRTSQWNSPPWTGCPRATWPKRYRELHGQPCRARQRAYLIRKVA